VETVFAARRLLIRRGDTTVLDVPSLAIGEGEFAGVVGPNGSGKTTLLEVLAGLQSPTEGEVRFRSTPLPSTPAAARMLAPHVATVLQPAVLFRGTVQGNVEFGLRMRGVPRGERRARAAEALRRLGLGDFGHRSAHALSRGEAQRVALARALALDAPVLLLDEPLAAVDPHHRRVVIDILHELKDAGRTVVMAAHDTDSVLALADVLLAMEGGRLHQQPLVNVLSGHVEMQEGLATFRTEHGLAFSCMASRSGPARLVVDPAAIILSRERLTSSARNCFETTVTRIEERGATTDVQLDAGDAIVATITSATEHDLAFAPGDTVYATVKTSSLKVLL